MLMEMKECRLAWSSAGSGWCAPFSVLEDRRLSHDELHIGRSYRETAMGSGKGEGGGDPEQLSLC